MGARFNILLCLHDGCGHEVAVIKGDLPWKCDHCGRPAKWRFALATEITQHDRRFLRSLKIAVEDLPLEVD